MKYLLALILFSSLSFANYSIYYTGVELGKIKNFDTLNENYLKAEVSNSIARFLLGKDYLILHNKQFNHKKNKSKYKYKKESSQIITILKKAYDGTLKPGVYQIDKIKSIKVTFDKHYNFVYTRKGKVKSEGYFIMKDGELVKLIEEKNDIEISKN